MSEEYIDLQRGQPIVGVLLSTSQSFTSLAALTDFYVPDASCWIGDYPYLDRNEVERLLAEDDDLWDSLEAQRKSMKIRKEDSYYGNNRQYGQGDNGENNREDTDSDFDDNESDSFSKVSVRRERRR